MGGWYGGPLPRQPRRRGRTASTSAPLAQAVSSAYTTASCASDILSVIEDQQQEFPGYQAEAEALSGLMADVMAEFEDYAPGDAREYDR